MEDTVEALVGLMLEAGQAHHQAFLATDGADDEWPLWYANYLKGRLPALLGRSITVSELVYALVHLSRRHPVEAPDALWARYYATYFAKHYAG
jgi:NAD(P)H-hydrate epimerase